MNRVTQPYFRGRCPPVIQKNHSKQKSLKYRKCRNEKSIDLLFTGLKKPVQLLRELGRGEVEIDSH